MAIRRREFILYWVAQQPRGPLTARAQQFELTIAEL